MKSFFIISIFFVFLLQTLAEREDSSGSGDISTEIERLNLPYEVVVQDDYGVHGKIKWDFDEQEITFEMTIKTTGWIGLGISPNGNMEGSDVAVMFVTDGGVPVIKDMHVKKKGDFSWWAKEPTLDKEQDLTLLYGFEKDGNTTVAFKRKLIVCDKREDLSITSDTMRVIWAFNTWADPIYYSPDNPERKFMMSIYPDYHTNKGAISLKLLSKSVQRPLDNDPDMKVYDVVASNATIPENQSTFYHCEIFKTPLDSWKKQHLVQVEPIIKNIKNVHHIIIYECSHLLQQDFSGAYPCYTEKMPLRVRMLCTKAIIGWAVGSGKMTYAEDRGQTIGGGENTYWLMETHYDNVKLESGIVDASGMRVWYTPNLREINVGVMEAGLLVTGLQVIAPKSKNWITSVVCPQECISSAMEASNVTEITVIGAMVHSHLAGRKMKIRHFRNGHELEPLFKDDNYDFNYQEYLQFSKEKTIRVGDALITECTYNTTSRENVTFGGLGTEEEMCVSFIKYYPEINLDRCMAANYASDIYRIFGGMKEPRRPLFQMTSWNSEAGQKAKENLTSIKWTDQKRQQVMKSISGKPYYTFCSSGPGFNKVLKPFPVLSEYVEPYDDTCRK